jgi:hypothetical protein
MTLGTVDSQGIARFSGDINACREFLYGLGLECTRQGWVKSGWLGMIEFHNGQHHAAAWQSRNA